MLLLFVPLFAAGILGPKRFLALHSALFRPQFVLASLIGAEMKIDRRVERDERIYSYTLGRKC